MKVIFNKSGSGSINTKVSIPIKWIKQMGITEEKREVAVKFNEEKQQIIIEKQK